MLAHYMPSGERSSAGRAVCWHSATDVSYDQAHGSDPANSIRSLRAGKRFWKRCTRAATRVRSQRGRLAAKRLSGARNARYNSTPVRSQFPRRQQTCRRGKRRIYVRPRALAQSLLENFKRLVSRSARVPLLSRRAIAVAPTKAFAALLEGNLGALLMSAGRLPEALKWMEKGIASSTAEQQLDSAAGVGRNPSAANCIRPVLLCTIKTACCCNACRKFRTDQQERK